MPRLGRPPLERVFRAQPAIAGTAAFDDFQRAILHASGGRLVRIERHRRRTRLRVIRGCGVRPVLRQRLASVEPIREQSPAARSIRRLPRLELALQFRELRIQLLLRRLPRFEFTGQVRVDDAVVWLRPLLDVERRIEHRLKRVVILLRDRLELVVMTLRALHRHTQQAGPDDLHRRFERVVAIGADLVRIAIALAGAVLAIAKEVRGFEQLDDLGRRGLTRFPAGQLVARKLLANKLVERLVAIQCADHVVAVAVGERTIRVGVEIAVGICVARSVEPMLAPAFAVARRAQETLNHPLVGTRLFVGHKARDLVRRRRQSGEHEGDAANERGSICFTAGCEAGFLQADGDHPVERRVSQRNRRGILERLEGPMIGGRGNFARDLAGGSSLGSDPRMRSHHESNHCDSSTTAPVTQQRLEASRGAVIGWASAVHGDCFRL